MSVLKSLGRWASTVPARTIAGFGLRPARTPPLSFVCERNNWSIRWDGLSIADHINEAEPGVMAVNDQPYRVMSPLVHYGSQYLWTAWQPYLSSQSRYIVTYFHGRPEDGPAAARNIDEVLRSLPKLDAVITASRAMEDLLLQWGVPPDKLHRIPIGVDTTHFRLPTDEERAAARARFGITPGQFCIGSFQKDGVGWGDGMEPKMIKGPDVFLDVVRRLSKEIDLVVLLTGPARGYVKAGLEKLGVQYHHQHLEHYPALASWFHALDAYPVTSREEGGPKAVMESMATGVPIISTRVGMAPDVIDHSVSGFLTNICDAESITQYCLKVASDPALVSKMTTTARNAVLDLDWRNVAHRHLSEVYSPIHQMLSD